MKEIFLIISLSIPIFCFTQNTKIPQDSISFHQSFMNIPNERNNSTMTRAITTEAMSGSFYVGGNTDTYYPVVFQDNNWDINKATILELGRSSAHTDSNWNGSLIASFKFHVTRWGHGSSFIDSDIKENIAVVKHKSFIGGWQDDSSVNNHLNIIIWLRGATTYKYYANAIQSPIVTNSSITIDGKTYNTKNEQDKYVNNSGETINRNLWVLGNSNNYFAGNVGIGTQTPQYKLDVNGNTQITDNLSLGKQLSPSAGGEVIRMSIVPYRHTGGPWNFVSRDTPSQAHLDINYGTSNALTIYTYNSETRIGIGTKNPQNKLDVAGTIRATEVKVEAQPWADFVFDKDYKLRSLEDVKAHIDEHKHLPDMPSEAKVKEDGGVGLGEMQVKLLQKIEELTLYMIQQDKTLAEQNSLIREQSKLIKEQEARINNIEKIIK